MSTLALFQREPVESLSSDAQCTPRELALALGRFGIDPCSNPRSHVQADRRCMLELGQDGLSDSWADTSGAPLSAFVNGPYSDPLPWCERLRAHRAPACCLWKLDTTTQWFEQLMLGGFTWAPFRNRLKYERPGNCGSADFPSFLAWRDWKPSRAVLQMLWKPRRG